MSDSARRGRGMLVLATALSIAAIGVAACVGDDPASPSSSTDDSGVDGSTGIDGSSADSNASDSPITLPDAGIAVVDVSAGFNSSCALLADGSVWCWGADDWGQLGVSAASLPTVATCQYCRPTPAAVPGLNNIKQISIGQQSCAVDNVGDVYCWGLNDLGELGHQSGTGGDVPCAPTNAECNPAPSKVAGLADVAKVVVGGNGVTCALTTGHSVFCWGSNQTLAIAQPDAAAQNVGATLIPGLTGKIVTDISLPLNAVQVCAAVQGEGVYCWGYNDNGQTGHLAHQGTDVTIGASAYTPAPAFVDPTTIVSPSVGSTDIVHLAAGQGCTCGATTDGGVVCWGNNQFGNFGNASYTPGSNIENTPLRSNATNMASLSGSGGSYEDTFCGRTGDSHVTCWGASDYGQLGNGVDNLVDAAAGADAGNVCLDGTHCADTPQTLAAPLAKIVSAAWNGVVVLGVDGKVYAWGQNTAGQLGHAPLTSGDDGACIVQPLGNSITPCNPRPSVVNGLP